MLAGMRSCSLLSFLLVFSVAAYLPVEAQIHGVPASVTSFGFGGSDNPTPGVRASVTSLGPNGFGNSRPVFGNCCANFFFPANQDQAMFFGGQFSGHQFSGRQSSGRHHRRGIAPISPSASASRPTFHTRFLTPSRMTRKPTMTQARAATSALLARET